MGGQWLGVEMDTALGGLSRHVVPNAEGDSHPWSRVDRAATEYVFHKVSMLITLTPSG